MKKIEDYIAKLIEEDPELKNVERGLKMYFTQFFKVWEKETLAGYSVRIGESMSYTFRTAQEQYRWDSLHKRVVYRKLKLWKKTTS
jgi:hypothetical protein